MKETLFAEIRRRGKPVHPKELARRFGLERREVKALLTELVEEGRLERERSRYRLPGGGTLLIGRLDLAQGGYGFVVPEDGSEDVFVPAARLAGAWHGDRVLVRVTREARGKKRTGEVVRVLERARRTALGTLRFSRGYAWLVPEDPRLPERIKLVPKGLESVPEGSRIAVRLRFPEETGGREPIGVFLERLGEGMSDAETETRAVILKHDLRDAFPKAVLKEAERVAAEPLAAALPGREDFRDLAVFTIDGADAKDFDDAIHLRRLADGGLEVGVHIADVSHYVREGSALDREARVRGTSVYLPGRVLPMLPERLSNGVCSLVPGEDRLVLSVIARLTPEGEVEGFRLAKGVIRSRARLTYGEVEGFLAGGSLPPAAAFLAEDLRDLFALTRRLRARREAEGAIFFDFPEVKVEFTPEGNVHLVKVGEARARSLIEELMLLANRLVAKTLSERGLPALYRVHEDPSEDRFRELSEALIRLGYRLGEASPAAYQRVLKEAEGRPEAPVVAMLLLRSLKLARYAEENLGHFGLAFRDYLHFTSPIRRYPDLVVHRVVKALIEGRLDEGRLEAWRARFPQIAEEASVKEREAEAAERELAKYYQARWARAHLGEVFLGTVSGVQNFGVFVALENGVEGLVRLEALKDDFYVYDPEALALLGERTGKRIRLGDAMRVQIAAANPTARQVDLVPVEEVKEVAKKEQKKRRRVVGPPEGKDRPERPVKLTVNRVYFGEWQGEEKKRQPERKKPKRG